jgi:hypothetical protein
VKRQAIRWNISNAEVSEQLSESFLGSVPVSEQVDVAGWALQSVGPKGEQERTLEEELIRVFGLAQPVQQTFNTVPGQSQIEILATVSAQIQQTLANGRRQVGQRFLVQEMASMYGLMTFATRQILA